MISKKDKLIEKIKILLALGSDILTTEHERDLALKHAQRLVAQYSVEVNLGGVEDGEDIITIPCTCKPIGILKSDSVFKLIIETISQNFGVYTFDKAADCYETNYLMGFSTNCEIADYTINVLISQGWVDCFRKSKELNQKSSAFHINFWNGFLEGLQKRFLKLSDDLTLVVYDRVKKEFDTQVSIRVVRNSYSSSNSGFSEGRESATNAQIRGAVGKGGNGGVNNNKGGNLRIG